jgi:2-polyprenyl-3-methyl-5-hydroxy-6-metoxy-1,4-benzoquinol methylase
MSNLDTARGFYEGYAQAKGWTGEDSASQFPFFDHLAGKAGLTPGRLLEVGFGEGALLDWAKARGYAACGNDIIPEMVEAGLKRDLDVRLGELGPTDHPPQSFQWIFAMDVLEHLTTAGIVEHLAIFRTLLKDGGKVIVRFPNGASPFFGFHQYGDVTHLTPLTPESLGQLARKAGMAITAELRLRPYPRSPSDRIKRWISYRARDLIELLAATAYYGRLVVLDVDATLVLEPA